MRIEDWDADVLVDFHVTIPDQLLTQLARQLKWLCVRKVDVVIRRGDYFSVRCKPDELLIVKVACEAYLSGIRDTAQLYELGVIVEPSRKETAS